MNERKKRKVGRPKGSTKSKYGGITLKDVRKFARLGLTDQQIAGALDISAETLYTYRREHPEFYDALRDGKQFRDDLVVQSLFQRAVGWEHPEDKIMQNCGLPVVVPTVRRYPGETAAQIFWLKNKRPDEWKERQELEIGAHVSTLAKSVADVLLEFVPEEARERCQQKLKQILHAG